MSVFVDVQGFKTDYNEFIIKEIAIKSGQQFITLQFKPPFSYNELTNTEKKNVCWIERNRQIFWDEGFIPYSYHTIYIRGLIKNKTIYVKGLEKVTWLKKILGYNMDQNSCIFNLEDKGCPNLLSLYKDYKSCLDVYRCINHSSHCALQNVTCMQKWCLENKCF